MSDKNLLESLNSLVSRINNHGGKLDASMLERYIYFIEHSEFGKDCSYARKCMDLFIKYDYNDVRALFLDVLEQFRLIEGKDFGK